MVYTSFDVTTSNLSGHPVPKGRELHLNLKPFWAPCACSKRTSLNINSIYMVSPEASVNNQFLTSKQNRNLIKFKMKIKHNFFKISSYNDFLY